MNELKLCTSDYRFMTIVWENEPIQSGNLVKISLEVLGWKKSTTYTMVKKLSEKGYLQNENSIVTSLIPKKYSTYGFKEKQKTIGDFSVKVLNNT